MPATSSVASQQLGEVAGAVAIGVHGLSEEHDLAQRPRRPPRAPVAQHGVDGQAALAAADVGHDAERAELVAAAHRPSSRRARPALAGAAQVGVGLVGIEPDVGRRAWRAAPPVRGVRVVVARVAVVGDRAAPPRIASRSRGGVDTRRDRPRGRRRHAPGDGGAGCCAMQPDDADGRDRVARPCAARGRRAARRRVPRRARGWRRC